jgi:hypothetical protein
MVFKLSFRMPSSSTALRFAVVALATAAAVAACRRPAPGPATPMTPPPVVLGDFEDDYGGRHTISANEWIQHPSNRFRIVRWASGQQFLVAENDSINKTDGGKWTRIDWIALEGMPPWEWAFCFSAYNAPTAAAAESTSVAKRDTPRTGCNGFPFSRLKRRSP